MATIKDLHDFINRAETDRKYAQNTAIGIRTALQLYEKQLNDEEKASIDLVLDRIDAIANAVDAKNKTFKTSSLLVYKRRVRNLIEAYKKYGKDSTTMASWQVGKQSPDKNKSSKKSNEAKRTSKSDDIDLPPVEPASMFSNLHDLKVQLRPDLRLSIPLPYDLTQKEAKRLKLLIDSMVLEVDGESVKL